MPCHCVWAEGYGFGTIDAGLCFLGICAGITISPITNALFQELHFQREFRRNGGRNMPEGRVRMGIITGIKFPIGLF